MKPLTTSIYTFSDLIRGGYLYVDKTPWIYELIREYKGQYFLARPRRFGKSLLISTLKSIFLGQRELFDGLYLADADYNWQTYPVIHLDLGDRAAGTAEQVEESLGECIAEQASAANISLSNATSASRFRELILKLYERKGPVVILIDEYDKPLLGHLGEPSASDIQKVLKGFYSVVKTTEPYQRFVLLTGVSKFSKVSVFSDLNNLTDLTMDRSAATLLGYTQSELERYFAAYIERLAEAEDVGPEQVMQQLSEWYNGYRFHEKAEMIYNPVSVMKCLQNCEFRNYWFETGTPTFLIRLLRNQPIDFNELVVPETAFSAYEPDELDPLPLLVQTGYLTIKETTMMGRRRQYRLAMPNYEIEESFSMWLAEGFCGTSQEELNTALNRMVVALQNGEVDTMLERLKTFFANIPNTITLKHEKYYQTIFFTVFKLIGTAVEAETSTNIGRIDAVVKADADIFLFEFKLRGTAREALDQMYAKEYAVLYRDDARRITLVGVAFDSGTRNLGDWLIEPRE